MRIVELSHTESRIMDRRIMIPATAVSEYGLFSFHPMFNWITLWASLTRWMWIWVNFGSWWWTGRPGVLRFMESQSWRQLRDWTELNCELRYFQNWVEEVEGETTWNYCNVMWNSLINVNSSIIVLKYVLQNKDVRKIFQMSCSSS